MPAAANVLLIHVDQMNARCLGLLGNANVATPNIDALAAEGVAFTAARCQSPICMPSRASTLSGQYPTTTRVFGFDGLGDRRSPQLASTFKRAGYRTGAFGKFHVHNIPPSQWDMDVAAPTLTEDLALARPATNSYMHFCRAHGHAWPVDHMHGHIPPQFHDRWSGPRVDPGPGAPPQQWYRSATPLDQCLETYTTNRCLEFLRDAGGAGRPFFAWLTYDRPHVPTPLPQPWFDRMCAKSIELPPVPSADELATLPRWMIEGAYRHPEFSRATLGTERFRWLVASYLTLIEFLDAEIGRVRQALADLGLGASTTVVFTSDHGDQAGWGGLFDKQLFAASDAIIRVPLVIRPAPVLRPRETGRLVHEPVELVDLFPTLCTLNGIAVPEAVEGTDLAPVLLHGAAADPDRAVVCEEYYCRTVVHRQHQLVFHTADANCLLFDLERDPHGFANRYDEPGLGPVRFDLKRRLLAFLCARQFGPYDQADVERIERGLDPDDPRLSLFVFDMPHCHGLHNHRAAALLYDGAHTLLVPFYQRQPALFGARFIYPSWRDQIAFDPGIAEPMLDKAIRECMKSVLPASRLEVERPAERRPDRAAIEDLHRRLSEAER